MKREEIGGGKTVERVMSDEEVLDELSNKQEVTEVELRQLAQNRARHIREFLVGDNQAGQGEEKEDQGHRPSQEQQAENLGQPVGDGEDGSEQAKQKNHTKPEDQATQENQVSQEGPMSEDRVFLLEVELGGAIGEQVRSQLNLSGA
jgi:hypothetical protein